MPPSTASPWQVRIANSLRVKRQWESKYKCSALEEYYEGFQWKSKTDSLSGAYNPYVINMVYSTIKIKLANLVFQRPSYNVSPAPGNSHWDMDFAVQSAQLKQDVLNTIVRNPNLHIAGAFKRAARDSFFRFGLLEVGYAADWRNPAKADIQLKSWDDPDVMEDKDRIVTDNLVPINEKLFVKRINPKKFIVSISEDLDLWDHDWCGYCEYFYTSQLKKTKGIKWPREGLIVTPRNGNQYYSREYLNDSSGEDDSMRRLMSEGQVSKVWHIFDNVGNKRRLLLEDDEYTEIWSEDLERTPIIDIRWDERSEGFYPVPPVFQWLSPQDEINETREQMRSYRRRFTAKYQVVKGMVDEEEAEKFASGPDGILIIVKEKDAISGIQNPALGNVNTQDLTIARDEFNIVSGTSADARGQDTDRTTATQSRIIDARTQIRESAEQLDFSTQLCLVGREILVQAQEKLVDGLWIKYSSNPSEGPLMDMQVNAPLFRFVKAQELSDGYDFTIDIDIQNSTPAAMQQAKAAYVEFVTLIAQFPMLTLSPVLIRETAYRCGYKNEQVIHQMQQAAVLAMAAKAGEAANAQGMTLDQAAGQSTEQAQMAQPAQPVIDKQISNQLM